MATALKLKSKWLDEETLRVSWVDVKANDNNLWLSMVIPLIFAGVFVYGIFLMIANTTFSMLAVGMVGLFISITWAQLGSTKSRNHVDFSADAIEHEGRKFSTAKITRFEYGLRSTLTGSGGQSSPMSDPNIIRMWIEDTRPHYISKNKWQNQVNHEIHSALTKALEAVRDLDKRQEHEAEFGKVDGDTGMPDY